MVSNTAVGEDTVTVPLPLQGLLPKSLATMNAVVLAAGFSLPARAAKTTLGGAPIFSMTGQGTPFFEAFRRWFAWGGEPPAPPPVPPPAPPVAPARSVRPAPVGGRFANLAVDPELTARAAEILRGIGESALAGEIRVAFNPRLRSTAGLAVWEQRLVLLNPRLMGLAADEPDRTLRHELAHVVARRRAGRRRIAAHGAEWRQACADLGIAGESVCHSLPLPRSRLARRYHYQCPACLALFRRARAIRHPVACYACCKRHAGGRYDAAFRLRKIAPPP
jgi:predicted SprT family Zn-dependent metalloprotease